MLDSLAWQIYRIMMKMEAQRKKIKAKHHVEPCGLRIGCRDQKRWEKMNTKLSRKMTEYGRSPLTMTRLTRTDT